jgi:hypothetical protein
MSRPDRINERQDKAMNMRTTPRVMTVLLFLFLATNAFAANDDKLSITLAKRAITVSGLSPGSTAVFFGVGQVAIPRAYMNQVRRWAVTVEDTDHKGTVTFDLQQDVPPASVWAVIDLRNAHYATISGPGIQAREIALDNPLRKGKSLSADRFAFDHGYLDLLYVHPGLGSWTWSAIGGSTRDNGGPNNSTIVSLSDGKAVGQSGSKPASFAPGGILVAVDFVRIEIAVVHVDQQLIGGAR